jgi:hypothetical protein
MFHALHCTNRLSCRTLPSPPFNFFFAPSLLFALGFHLLHSDRHTLSLLAHFSISILKLFRADFPHTPRHSFDLLSFSILYHCNCFLKGYYRLCTTHVKETGIATPLRCFSTDGRNKARSFLFWFSDALLFTPFSWISISITATYYVLYSYLKLSKRFAELY